MDLRKLVLDRARQQLALVSQGCQRAIEAIDRDSESTLFHAIDSLKDVEDALEDATARLQVLSEAEQDFYKSPYLIQPSKD